MSALTAATSAIAFNPALVTEHELAAAMIELDREVKRIVHRLAEIARGNEIVDPGVQRDLYDLALAEGARKDTLSEIFRRRFYPRAHRVVAVNGEVFTISRTGRSIVKRYDDGRGCDCGAHAPRLAEADL